MSIFNRDGLSFNFEEFGSGAPLIFSHGLGASLVMTRDLIGQLKGVRVIIYDNRGHGRTSGAGDASRLTFTTMAGDMAALLDHLKIDSAVVGGESMGAGISIAFWKHHRKRARGLILTRPAWLSSSYPPNLAILGTMGKLITEFGREQAPAHFARSDAFRQLRASHPGTANSLARILEDPTNKNLAIVYEKIPASTPYENVEELKGIDIPTLVIANRNDPLHPFDCAERLAAAIPGAKLHEIPSKYESLEEHRNAFRRLVTEFIHTLRFPQAITP